jgi:segregation and condensation protein B
MEERLDLVPESAAGDAANAAEPAPPEPERSIDDARLEREIAALLFASPEPLTSAKLAQLARVPASRVEGAVAAVARRLEVSGLAIELRAIAGAWQLVTSPDVAETVAALAKAPRDEKISPASLETLSVVAYRQPVTKAEIEAIRGVQVGPILRALVDRGLVRVCGRSSDPGHALLYGTTKRFLDVFGLAQLSDLPRDGELMRD